MRRISVFIAAWIGIAILSAGVARASGGVVKLKSNNNPGGYYYNANGRDRARYGAFYLGGEFDGRAIICGIRTAQFDQSQVTPGVDDYILGGDLRAEDGNHPGYADLSGTQVGSGGLIALVDPASLASCSTFGYRTMTFGSGAGIPDPFTPFVLTCRQPANNDPSEGLDFCGIWLDLTSAFVNSARTQAYSSTDPPIHSSIGFNHLVEAIVLEPRNQDLNVRMTGSSRFPGDPGLPVMFARRRCDAIGPGCVSRTGDSPVSTSDDFVTARIIFDNNTSSPLSADLTIAADRSGINPKLGPRDITSLFRLCGGGAPLMNPLMLQPRSRTYFCLEIKTIIKRRLLASLPVDLPFEVRASDPNAGPNQVPFDVERGVLGLRPCAGYYDNDSHAGGFFFSQTPVQTGDSLLVRYDVVDLQNRDNTSTPYLIGGVQIVGGEFGESGLAGLDAVEIRTEDPILFGEPDLTPDGLVRSRSTVGDPGNADGLPFGPPPTTVNIDLTDLVILPGDFGQARNLLALAYLNPGDTGASVTSIGSTAGGQVFVGNSAVFLSGVPPSFPFIANDLEIRLDHGGELIGPDGLRDGPRTGRVLRNAPVRAYGQGIAIDDQGNRLE